MSSTNKTANYQLSQFVGTDIPSILNDYNGDMRKIDSAIKETSIAGGDNATAIAELQATTGRLSTEVGGINATVNSVSGRVLGIEDKIPANASAENKLITAEDIPEIPSISGLEQSVAELQEEVSDMGGDVKAIQLCVPASASESNKFATMADIGGKWRIAVDNVRLNDIVTDVNVQTSIANFISEYADRIANHEVIAKACFCSYSETGSKRYHDYNMDIVKTIAGNFAVAFRDFSESTADGLKIRSCRVQGPDGYWEFEHYTTNLTPQGITIGTDSQARDITIYVAEIGE